MATSLRDFDAFLVAELVSISKRRRDSVATPARIERFPMSRKEIQMANECIAYRDSKGGLHGSPERASLEDLAAVLGRVGDEGGMTAGVARMIFDKRQEIERVFAEYDGMIASKRQHDHIGQSAQPIHVVK